MTKVGFFSEMNTSDNCGSVHDFITDTINYDVEKMIGYLSSFSHKASCAKNAIDCVTGNVISPYFLVYDDGEFSWCDYLIYHIKNYKISLPQGLIEKAKAYKPAQQ